MPDENNTREVINRYLKARVPLIVIQSIEPNRVMNILAECASGLQSMAFYEHSRTEGVRDVLSGQSVAEETSLAIAIEHARSTFKSRTNVNFIFTDVEDLDQETSQSRHFAEMVRLAESRSCSIVIVTGKPVWPGLARLGMAEKLDLPTIDELAGTLGEFIDANAGSVKIDWQWEDVRRAAEVLSGVTEMEAINVLASLMTRGHLRVEDLPELSRHKDKIFGDLSGLQRIPLRDDYKLSGLRTLRDWLAARRSLMHDDLSVSKARPLKGILLVGVPGCGKSLSARAIAQEWELPLYRLDVASVLGMYMGQSEGQLREALDTADRVAPCVLWIDEIEKAFATGLGDSGTTRRLIGQFLFWLQESTSKTFIVATANEVQSLPPELLRKGRFDEIFFVDLPDAEDRREMMTSYFRKYLDYDIDPIFAEELVGLSDGFSGSEIDAVIMEILQKHHAEIPGYRPSDAEVRQHFTNVYPFSQTSAEDLALIRSWGASRCLPAGNTVSVPGDGPLPRRILIT